MKYLKTWNYMIQEIWIFHVREGIERWYNNLLFGRSRWPIGFFRNMLKIIIFCGNVQCIRRIKDNFFHSYCEYLNNNYGNRTLIYRCIVYWIFSRLMRSSQTWILRHSICDLLLNSIIVYYLNFLWI